MSIVYKPKDGPASAEGYNRQSLREARLIAGHGIEGDSKGGSAKRQLNVMAHEIVQELAGEGFLAEPGQLGEQLILSGVKIDSLPIGTHLKIGESAVIELVEPRTGCGKFERHQSRLKSEAAGRMGMMAMVTADGVIRVGDPVIIVAK